MKEKILKLINNYKFWVIVVLILFITYLIFSNPSIHMITDTTINFDKLPDTTTVGDTINYKQ